MRIVSDASPLIFLARIKSLHFLKSYDILIPDQVYAEIKLGKSKQKTDYISIDALIEKGRIHVMKVTKGEAFPFVLGKGEEEVITLALQEKVKVVLLDDKKARNCAKIKGLKVRGTLAILMQQFKDKNITSKELKKLIFELVRQGFRIKEEIIVELLDRL